MSEGCCGTCRYYNPDELECRRRAPVFNDACGAIWPQDIKPNDWCGEYSKGVIHMTRQEPPHD